MHVDTCRVAGMELVNLHSAAAAFSRDFAGES